MKALVTGSSGLVGSAMSEKLLDLGYEVLGVDINPPRLLSVIVHSNYRFIVTDVRRFFNDVLDGPQYDLVVHCAAVVGGRATIEGNPLAVATDLAIDSDMFQWALRTKQKRLVLFSSSAAYPIKLQSKRFYDDIPGYRLKESDLDLRSMQSPDLSYGFCKLALEYQAMFVEEQGIRCHVFRPFSGCSWLQDEDYPWPAIARRAINHSEGLEDMFVWANTIRDFIVMDDVVAGVMAAVEQDVKGPVNLCTGLGTSFVDLAIMFCEELGMKDVEVGVMNDMPAGVYHRVGDPSKMLSIYQPKWTLERMIDETLSQLTV